MYGRKTKIIVTLGPSTDSSETVRELVAAGMDAARLNFSHGEPGIHAERASWVRRASEAEGRAVALIQDIQGPKIRLGTFPGGAVTLARDAEVELVAGEGEGSATTLPIAYDALADDVRPGEPVFLADGQVRLEVTERRGDRLVAVVKQEGEVRSRQGAAFPESELAVSAVTEKDLEDLAFGRELEVDYVAASFVCTPEEVSRVRELAGVPVISKIERAAAYEHLEPILAVSHGAMVARGDLGVELAIERLPLVQREILAAANRCGVVSITATEMLESMTTSTRPTRAEVTDIANAILQGSDVVMMSGETAIGRHPLRVVRAMDLICREVDASAGDEGPPRREFITGQEPIPAATCRAAVEAAEDLELATIVAFTESGSTARLLSKYRPRARIVAFTPEPPTYRRMALYRGVRPRFIEQRFDSTDEMLLHAEARLLREGLVRRDETVVMVAGIPPNRRSSTNFLKLHRVGSAPGTPGARESR